MGAKRNKIKKVFSPHSSNSPPNDVDNDDLMDDLFSQLDSNNESVKEESAVVMDEIEKAEVARDTSKGRKDSKNRFLARKARKASALAQNHKPDDEEETARIERETKEEERLIRVTCDELSVEIHEINPDGHCLFAAIADQLQILSMLPAEKATYANVRHVAADYLESHPDDFLPFLPSMEGEDGTDAGDVGIMKPEEFRAYCESIRSSGVWGGEPEIMALSRAYEVSIHVIQGGQPPVVVHDPSGSPGSPDMNHLKEQKAVRISYHRKMYGLGEHYNSLRPQSGIHRLTSPIRHLLQ